MTEEVSYRTRGEIPEAASATSIVLLTLATIACGVGAMFWWHAPLAVCALVVGSYVLHLFAIRRAARDAVVAHSAEARRVSRLREQEFEQQLREVSRLQPELEKERARMEEQWRHLKGLVDEREGRKKTLKEYEASLESVRREAAAALAAARLEVRTREASESELRDRIAELEADRVRAIKALRAAAKRQPGKQAGERAGKQARAAAEAEARAVVADAEETARALVAVAESKLESARTEEREREQASRALAGQIEELEAARTEAEEALRAVARAGALRSRDVSPTYDTRPRTLDQPRLRAWQFIAHKRELARRREG